jgi:RecB family exonuclease
LRSIEVKNYDNLSDLEKIALVDFSYSRIDTYNQCAAKYFYSYISKEPRQFSPAAVLGNIVHEVFENVLDNESQLDLDQLKSEYASAIPKYDPSNQISTDLLDAGSVIIEDFFDTHHEEKFNIFAKEMGFELIIGSYIIRGFIDRVDVRGDIVHIIDYKTGKWEVSSKEVPNNLQLGIYALAASLIFPEKKVYAELYYLRSGRRKGHTFSYEDIENVKIKLIDQMKKIVEDVNYLPTSNTRICSYCDHAKSGACGTGVYRNSKIGK